MGKKERNKVFQTQDPYKRKVILYEDTFEEHIMLKHYYSSNQDDIIKDIQNTVENPEEIFYDKQIEKREIFSRKESHVSENTIVVVDYSQENSGIVTTSYPTHESKWRRQMKDARKKYPENKD